MSDGTGRRGFLLPAIRECVILAAAFVLVPGAQVASAQMPVPASAAAPTTRFPWPDGRRGAVSLSFDDARLSQVDVGIPLLDELGVKATFYVQPENARKRLEGWRKAAAHGHEIGNHTSSHPCTDNFAFSRANALEDYTVDRLEQDVRACSDFVARELGTPPVSFAYPCGETFVGRGPEVRSYVPLIARAFGAGRLFLSEDANDPAFCDLAQLLAVEFDGKSVDALRPLLEKAAAEGRWLILAGHEIGSGGRQTTLTDTLAAVCRYARDPANGLWIDTVGHVAAHVRAHR